jgi:hypothetical protein
LHFVWLSPAIAHRLYFGLLRILIDIELSIEDEVEGPRYQYDDHGGNVGDDGGSVNIILELKSARERLWKT